MPENVEEYYQSVVGKLELKAEQAVDPNDRVKYQSELARLDEYKDTDNLKGLLDEVCSNLNISPDGDESLEIAQSRLDGVLYLISQYDSFSLDDLMDRGAELRENLLKYKDELANIGSAYPQFCDIVDGALMDLHDRLLSIADAMSFKVSERLLADWGKYIKYDKERNGYFATEAVFELNPSDQAYINRIIANIMIEFQDGRTAILAEFETNPRLAAYYKGYESFKKADFPAAKDLLISFIDYIAEDDPAITSPDVIEQCNVAIQMLKTIAVTDAGKDAAVSPSPMFSRTLTFIDQAGQYVVIPFETMVTLIQDDPDILTYEEAKERIPILYADLSSSLSTAKGEEGYLAKGRLSFFSGDYDDAEKNYLSWLNSNPEDEEGIERLKMIALKKCDLAERLIAQIGLNEELRGRLSSGIEDDYIFDLEVAKGIQSSQMAILRKVRDYIGHKKGVYTYDQAVKAVQGEPVGKNIKEKTIHGHVDFAEAGMDGWKTMYGAREVINSDGSVTTFSDEDRKAGQIFRNLDVVRGVAADASLGNNPIEGYMEEGSYEVARAASSVGLWKLFNRYMGVGASSVEQFMISNRNNPEILSLVRSFKNGLVSKLVLFKDSGLTYRDFASMHKKDREAINAKAERFEDDILRLKYLEQLMATIRRDIDAKYKPNIEYRRDFTDFPGAHSAQMVDNRSKLPPEVLAFRSFDEKFFKGNEFGLTVEEVSKFPERTFKTVSMALALWYSGALIGSAIGSFAGGLVEGTFTAAEGAGGTLASLATTSSELLWISEAGLHADYFSSGRIEKYPELLGHWKHLRSTLLTYGAMKGAAKIIPSSLPAMTTAGFVGQNLDYIIEHGEFMSPKQMKTALLDNALVAFAFKGAEPLVKPGGEGVRQFRDLVKERNHLTGEIGFLRNRAPIDALVGYESAKVIEIIRKVRGLESKTPDGNELVNMAKNDPVAFELYARGQKRLPLNEAQIAEIAQTNPELVLALSGKLNLPARYAKEAVDFMIDIVIKSGNLPEKVVAKMRETLDKIASDPRYASILTTLGFLFTGKNAVAEVTEQSAHEAGQSIGKYFEHIKQFGPLVFTAHIAALIPFLFSRGRSWEGRRWLQTFTPTGIRDSFSGGPNRGWRITGYFVNILGHTVGMNFLRYSSVAYIWKNIGIALAFLAGMCNSSDESEKSKPGSSSGESPPGSAPETPTSPSAPRPAVSVPPTEDLERRRNEHAAEKTAPPAQQRAPGGTANSDPESSGGTTNPPVRPPSAPRLNVPPAVPSDGGNEKPAEKADDPQPGEFL